MRNPFAQLLAGLPRQGFGAPQQFGQSPLDLQNSDDPMSMPTNFDPQQTIGSWHQDNQFDPFNPPFQPMGWDQQPELPDRLPPDHPLHQYDILPPGGPAANPGFMEFFKQHDPHDIAMASAIAAYGVTDPKTAIQWALQFKEQRDRQRWAAEQADLNRQNQQELAKQKAQYDKAKQDETTFNKLLSQAQAMAGQYGYDLQGDVAQFGQPTTPEEAKAIIQRITNFNSQQKQAETVRKEKDSILKGILKGQQTPPAKFTDPNSPLYDPQFVEDVNSRKAMREQFQQDRLDRDKQMLELRNLQAEYLKAKSRIANGSMSDQEKLQARIDIQRATMAFKVAMQSKAEADKYDVFEDDWPKAGEVRQQANDNYAKHYQEALDLLGAAEGGGEATTTPTPTPTPPPQSRPTNSGAKAAPFSPDAQIDNIVRGWQKAVEMYGREKAAAAWTKKYGIPPPDEIGGTNGE